MKKDEKEYEYKILKKIKDLIWHGGMPSENIANWIIFNLDNLDLNLCNDCCYELIDKLKRNLLK